MRRLRSGGAPGALLGLLAALALSACGGDAAEEPRDGTEAGPAASGLDASPTAVVGDERSLGELWNDGATAFGVYVPDERPMEVARSEEGQRQPAEYSRTGAANLASNPLYDFLFLNLEGSYDPAAVETVSSGVNMAELDSPPTLLVRIPPMSDAGVETTRERVREILAAGADGVVLPHIRNVEEARTAVGLFEGFDIWSPENPDGPTLAMIMLEDPEAIGQLEEIIDLGGYSVLACGIGSLTDALDGDREEAERMCGRVLEEGQAAGYASMITASADNIEARVEEGHRALLLFGQEADAVIRTGRGLAGR